MGFSIGHTPTLFSSLPSPLFFFSSFLFFFSLLFFQISLFSYSPFHKNVWFLLLRPLLIFIFLCQMHFLSPYDFQNMMLLLWTDCFYITVFDIFLIPWTVTIHFLCSTLNLNIWGSSCISSFTQNWLGFILTCILILYSCYLFHKFNKSLSKKGCGMDIHR